MTVYSKLFPAAPSLTAGLLLLALTTGCSPIASDPKPAKNPSKAETSAPDGNDEEKVRAVNDAIRTAIGPSGGWEKLRLQVECVDDGAAYTMDVYGNGIGIWNRKSQFQASRDQLIAALDALLQADFASMRNMYGGKGDPDTVRTPVERQPLDGKGVAAMRVVCWIALDLDGEVKRSGQLDQGHQYPPLTDLAQKVLRQFRATAQAGVGADGLTDGLQKIASGDLAPEAMRVMLQQRAEPREREAPGFQLRLFGGEVTTRPYTRAEGYGMTHVLKIDERELADLTTAIARSGVETFPSNLYSGTYTDFEVEVLQYKKALQARQFSGMTESTHGEAQEGFDHILEKLLDLHARALRDGQASPTKPVS